MDQPDNLSLPDCVFCRPDIITNSFCSSPQFTAIYNIAPVLPGHSLIIPIAHHQSIFHLSDSQLTEMMLLARKVTTILMSVFKSDGFDWSIQDGAAAGQTIPHLHLHIIPRRLHDLPPGEDWYGKIEHNKHIILDSLHRDRLTPQQYNDITAQLSRAVSSSLNIDF